MTSRILFLERSDFRQFTKWSLMMVALGWVAVYTLSQHSDRLPEFVYVNF